MPAVRNFRTWSPRRDCAAAAAAVVWCGCTSRRVLSLPHTGSVMPSGVKSEDFSPAHELGGAAEEEESSAHQAAAAAALTDHRFGVAHKCQFQHFQKATRSVK